MEADVGGFDGSVTVRPRRGAADDFQRASMILETVLWWMPVSDAMRFSAVPSACAERIEATTAAGFVVAPASTRACASAA